MISAETARKLTVELLLWNRQDLRETIQTQEAMARQGFRTPKLSDYVDEFYAVEAELIWRRSRPSHEGQAPSQ